MKILVVDDEKDVVELISFKLQREGHEVVAAGTGEEALRRLPEIRPDLLILDIMLPGIQGLEVCRLVRENHEFSNLPIIMVSAKSAESDRIQGFEMGADDYLTKPFNLRELISRVNVALRRSNGHKKKPEATKTFTYKGLFIDYDKYEISLNGKRMELSPIETRLLFFFTKNCGRVYSRDQLLDHVWGSETFVTPRSVDVHVSRLRKLIEKDIQDPVYIKTVRGVGYKFDDNHMQ